MNRRDAEAQRERRIDYEILVLNIFFEFLSVSVSLR